MNIYFICTGNTCRSPMAEAILRSKENENWVVRSAGIHAQNGIPIAEHAKKLIEEAGMPYTPVSRALSTADVHWADIIFTMTDIHKRTLLNFFPEAAGKVYTLKGFVNTGLIENEDVHDPFGGSIEIYRYTFEELALTIEAINRKLTEGLG